MIAQISSVLLLLARNRVLLTVVVFDVAWCLREADETADLEDDNQSRAPFRLPVQPEGNWFFRVFEKEELRSFGWRNRQIKLL